MEEFLKTLWQGVQCKCPQCQKGNLYPSFLNLSLKDNCDICGLDLSKNDSADGPAVFLIFVLGFFIVPLALWVDAVFSPALYIHAILWGIVLTGLTIGLLKPIKSYIIFLQYKYLPDSWNTQSKDSD